MTDVDGQILVEVVDDHVSAHTPGASTTGMAWREVEVELGGDGDPELLDRVERRLLDAGARRSDARSKLARVLGDRLPAPVHAPRPGHKAAIGEVLLAYLREQAEAIVWGDPATAPTTPTATAHSNASSIKINRRRLDTGQLTA